MRLRTNKKGNKSIHLSKSSKKSKANELNIINSSDSQNTNSANKTEGNKGANTKASAALINLTENDKLNRPKRSNKKRKSYIIKPIQVKSVIKLLEYQMFELFQRKNHRYHF